jgi:UDPglucose 6-dehydrogenase
MISAMSSINKIMIFGAGYVGTSLSILLSQKFQVTLIDTDPIKINKLKQNISPIEDSLIQKFIDSKDLNIIYSTKFEDFIAGTDLVILALPTNFIDEKNSFDTNILEDVISKVHACSSDIPMLIKSTVPIGFTLNIQNKYKNIKIFFSPEFLREGMALEDNLKPSRIIIGGEQSQYKIKDNISKIFTKCCLNDPPILFMSSNEAESVKLFSNTFLALRVSYFNELDSYCIDKNLDPKNVIDGVSLDSRIGSFYNNPSFGYGGYCLPKDTKQLLSNFNNIPQNLIDGVIDSNSTRKKYIANKILALKPKKIGIYRLIMKKGSDNIRESAIFDIINILKNNNIEIIVYEPLLESFENLKIISSLDIFKKESDIVMSNRMHSDIADIKNKVFTRDIYNSD